MKNYLDLTLIIYGFDDISHDELSMLIDIQPTYIRHKGQKKNPSNPDSPLFEENRWGVCSGIDKHADFDEHLTALLDIIEPRIEILEPICAKYLCEISCGMFVYYGNEESTPWVHFDARYNRINASLNIEFDLDLYVFQNKD